jgi:hypothetical protein
MEQKRTVQPRRVDYNIMNKNYFMNNKLNIHSTKEERKIEFKYY